MTDQTDAPNPQTILVIDDESDIRRLLRLAPEEAGYGAREAERDVTDWRSPSKTRALRPFLAIAASAE